ncbi:MAG TPA: hypothetical protein VGR64_06260 [Terracidiphilus sp.]|nr:hypothetical protein [Terracidiphilus sp.]
MRRGSILRTTTTLVAAMALGIFAYAQHGHPGGVGAGLGAGSGLGAGLGASANANAGAGLGRAAGPGANGIGNANLGGGASASRMGSSAPDAVLSNTHLNASLTAALGKSGVSIPGGDLQTACAGFKNLGTCVAALHAAQNLNVPFADLQARMTGSDGASLGKAIQGVEQVTATSKAEAKQEAKKAIKQTRADLQTASRLSANANATASANANAGS